MIDFVRRWSEATEIGAARFIRWLGVAASKFYHWRERYGRANEHNGWLPRDFWLEDWEKQAILDFHIQRAKEKFPEARPRIISDNGPQFIARDFKEFIRISGMTHVKTSPYYPQSNGKIERWHQSLKKECIRPGTPLSLDDARRLVAGYVEHYNTVRLHSAISYVTPQDMLEGRQRDQKLEAARELRRLRRQATAAQVGSQTATEVN